jgi:hypothetical protein
VEPASRFRDDGPSRPRTWARVCEHPFVPRRRTVVLGVVAIVLVAGAVVGGPPLLLEFDETATPPASAARLPDGVRVGAQEFLCASGGCWQQLTLSVTDGQDVDDFAAAIGAPYETCYSRSWIDRRTVCTHVELVGGELRADVQYRRHWGL